MVEDLNILVVRKLKSIFSVIFIPVVLLVMLKMMKEEEQGEKKSSALEKRGFSGKINK